MTEVVMPALGMAMSEGRVVAWLKQPGDAVQAGDPIAEIETDKANVEVPSTASGRVGELLAAVGAVIATGVVIARIVEEGPAPDGATAEPTNRSAPAPSPRTLEDMHRQPSVVRDLKLLTQTADSSTLVLTSLDGLPEADLIEWLETMLLIREFEGRADPLALEGKIPGGMHSSAGQEGVAVGVARALAPGDIVASSHRSHHHSLAKGLPPDQVMAELYGKATGCLGGRAGHMHLADFSLGLYGSNGIVGGGLGIAMGASLAAKMRGLDQVAVGFFGDGGANTGRVWEFINLASIWTLPLIAVCENNLYAVETHVERVTAAQSIGSRASEFGLPALQVDGQDVGAVWRAVSVAAERARAGEGPTFIEALTYRYEGHNTGDIGNYRDQAEVDSWRNTRDPIQRLVAALKGPSLLGAGGLEQMVQHARRRVERAVRFAEDSPWPDPNTAALRVTGLNARVREGL